MLASLNFILLHTRQLTLLDNFKVVKVANFVRFVFLLSSHTKRRNCMFFFIANSMMFDRCPVECFLTLFGCYPAYQGTADQMTPAARCSCSSPSLYNPNVSSWKPILFPVCTRADTHLLCVHLQYNLGKMRFLCRMLSFHPGKVREGYFCFPYMRSHTHASSDFL